ncbi:MAG TPA: thiamine pyrophosphate-dependent enzyme [Candidatus Binatia bacterium]|nr:thiamine pyrophosphate-dependent enzyme [Candidatus Binatia bacterium]
MTIPTEKPAAERGWNAETAEGELEKASEFADSLGIHESLGLDEPAGPLAHPAEPWLRDDRLPHIWCPGCGIGVAVSAFVAALREAEVDPQRLALVSGIGCTGRVAGYMRCDSFHTTHGRAVPFAMGLHLGNPALKVVVFSGDGDLVAIGGNHLIHAARRNADLTVFCVNNFTYGMTGGQSGPTTQEGARTSTAPYGSVEVPFNLPRLVAAAGATYVARWTVLDLGRLRRSMVEALGHRGFAFVEIVSPCPVYYGRRNRLGEAIDEVRYYHENTVVDNAAPLDSLDLLLGQRITVGKFVDSVRPTFEEAVGERLVEKAQADLRRR